MLSSSVSPEAASTELYFVLTLELSITVQLN